MAGEGGEEERPGDGGGRVLTDMEHPSQHLQEDLGLGAAARSAILKVMRAVPEPFRPAAAATSQRILVDPARWMRSPDPVGQLGVLQTAVFTGRRLRLRYRSSGQGSALERVVDPYGLVSKAGIWYLVADQDGEPRLFRVSRVLSAVADEGRCGGGTGWISRSCGRRCGSRWRSGRPGWRWWSGSGGRGGGRWWACGSRRCRRRGPC